MNRIEPDSVVGRPAPLLNGEQVRVEFRADRTAYWRAHLIMAVVLGTAAGVFLVWQGNPYPVAGPFGAILAIGARAAYLASEALTEVWRLTDRRLLGPGGLVIPLASLKTAHPFLGSVQVVTASGDKHLMKYLADPAGTAAQLLAARNRPEASGG